MSDEVYCKLANYLEEHHHGLYRIIKQHNCWLGFTVDKKFTEAVFKKPESSFSFVIPHKDRLPAFRKLLANDEFQKVFDELKLSVITDSKFDGSKNVRPVLLDGTTLVPGFKFSKIDALVGPSSARIHIYEVTEGGELKGASATASGGRDHEWCPRAQKAFEYLSDSYVCWIASGGFGPNPLVSAAMCMKMALEKSHPNELSSVMCLVHEPRLFPFVVLGPNSPFIESCADVVKLTEHMREHLAEWVGKTFVSTDVNGGNDDLNIPNLESVISEVKEYLSKNGWSDDLDYGLVLLELNYRVAVRLTLAQKTGNIDLAKKTIDLVKESLQNKSACFFTTISIIPAMKQQGIRPSKRLFTGHENIRELITSITEKPDVDMDKLDEVASVYMVSTSE